MAEQLLRLLRNKQHVVFHAPRGALPARYKQTQSTEAHLALQFFFFKSVRNGPYY